MNLLYVSVPGGGLDTNIRVLAPALARVGHSISVLYVHYPGAGATAPIPEIKDCRVYHATTRSWHYYFDRITLGISSLPLPVRSLEYARAIRDAVVSISARSPLDLIELPEIFIPAHLLGAIPYVTRLHASAWLCRQMAGERAFGTDRVEKRWEGDTLRRARGISSPCHFTAELVRSECHIGSRRIEIIPYPVDLGQFAPGTRSVNPPVILFVGRVEIPKGADVLLRAIPLVHKRFPDCEFVFVGKVSDDLSSLVCETGEGRKESRVTAINSSRGPARVDLQAGAGPGAVKFLGVLPNADLAAWYQRASIFVAPSIWDNSPNTIYEAMACGTPVIASRVGGIPELVADGETGLLVPPGDETALADALVALLGDAPRRERMGEKARARSVAHYSVDKILNQTLSFYERILAVSQ